jgi:hypothetical protein
MHTEETMVLIKYYEKSANVLSEFVRYELLYIIKNTETKGKSLLFRSEKEKYYFKEV